MRTLRAWLDKMWAWHQVRYLIVAGVTSVVSWCCVAMGLFFGWHYLAATVFAQIAPIPFAFPAYRTLVFESRGTLWADFVRFLSVWTGGTIIGIGAAPFLVEVWHFHPVAAQIFVTAVVAIGSYLAHRFFTFRKRTQ